MELFIIDDKIIILELSLMTKSNSWQCSMLWILVLVASNSCLFLPDWLTTYWDMVSCGLFTINIQDKILKVGWNIYIGKCFFLSSLLFTAISESVSHFLIPYTILWKYIYSIINSIIYLWISAFTGVLHWIGILYRLLRMKHSISFGVFNVIWILWIR